MGSSRRGLGDAARAADDLPGGARRLHRAEVLRRGQATRQLGRQAAGFQEEARPRRPMQWDDCGAGGAADGARPRLGL